MYRDGVLKSIWQSEIQKDENKQIPSHKSYDVVIVGGGITGFSCAIELQSQGKNCILIEAENIGFGTSGGTTAHLNTFFDASYDQVIEDFGVENAKLFSNAGIDAIEIIRKNIYRYGISCGFEDKKAYIFARDDEQEDRLNKIQEAANQVNISMVNTHDSPFPIPFKKIVELTGQAQFHPVHYILGLKKAFVDLGGEYLENTRVLGHSKNSDTLSVETTSGNFDSEFVIYATHTPIGVNLLHFKTSPWRSYAIGVELKNNEYPQALGYDLAKPYHYYRSQKLDGKQYLIVGGKDHKTGETPEINPLEALENHVREFFDVERIAFAWSSQFYESADGLPYIGKTPFGSDQVFVATGFTGNGMIFGTLSGQIISDLIIGTENKFAHLFNPRRVKPVAEFSEVASHNLNVAAHWIGDKISKKHLKELSSLNPNEGKVVSYDGNTYAIFRDAGGEIHALKSLCTHVQCTVKWNSSELTWDCPCHGSRFGVKGNVLNSPAVKPLDRIDLLDDED